MDQKVTDERWIQIPGWRSPFPLADPPVRVPHRAIRRVSSPIEKGANRSPRLEEILVLFLGYEALSEETKGKQSAANQRQGDRLGNGTAGNVIPSYGSEAENGGIDRCRSSYAAHCEVKGHRPSQERVVRAVAIN